MNKSQLIATASIYAAMYVGLVLLFSPISYGPVNLRVANILIGLVPILGWPAIIGQGLGVFIANQPAFGDSLGYIDLINVVPSVVFAFVIWKLRKTSVFLGLTLYSLALGMSVSFALNSVGFLASPAGVYIAFAYVTTGIFIVTAILGYVFYKSVKKLGVLQRRFPD